MGQFSCFRRKTLFQFYSPRSRRTIPETAEVKGAKARERDSHLRTRRSGVRPSANATSYREREGLHHQTLANASLSCDREEQELKRIYIRNTQTILIS